MIMATQNDSFILNDINNEEVKRQIPLMIYLIFIGITGIVGNSLVCYVFKKIESKSTYRTFVIFVSSVDLFTCCICLPLQFIMQIYKYNYFSKSLCKVSLLVNTWTTLTSCFVLLCIAFDRYRKVCFPFSWQVSLKAAKYMCLTSVGIGLACSWISAIIYDIQTEKHSFYNVTIAQCMVTDDMKQTLFPLINNITFAVMFVGVFIITVCFYSCIAVRIRQQTRWKQKDNGRTDSKENKMKITTEIFCEMTDTKNGDTLESEQDTNFDNSFAEKTDNYIKVKTENKSHQYVKKGRSDKYKITKIMFMVTLAAIISFTPVISLLLTRSLDKTFVQHLDNTQRTVYNFFLRSYFINSAVNPMIYGILDVKFRSSCKRVCSRNRA